MPETLSHLLDNLIQTELTQLRAFPDNRSAIRPAGETSWSPREELGHLIDSAINNHVRFVAASIQPEYRGPSYAQNEWVRAHGYQQMPWLSIVDSWAQHNALIAIAVRNIPEDKTQTVCFVGSGEPVSLQFLVEDYVLHAQHHIDHLLERPQVTPYPRP